MIIYANSSVRIDESLSKGSRSSINIYGNVSYLSSLAWEDRGDVKNLFDEFINWKNSFAGINFYRLEEGKEENSNDYGWLVLDGTFCIDKEGKNIVFKCSCGLSSSKWHQLKSDLLIDDLWVEFTINQINAGRLSESDSAIESKIVLFMDSYSLVKNRK